MVLGVGLRGSGFSLEELALDIGVVSSRIPIAQALPTRPTVDTKNPA